MKQHRILFPSLGVAGKFESTDSQIGVPLAFDRGLEEGLQGMLMALEDKIVCTGDASHGRGVAHRQHQRIIEAAWTLQHGSTPCASPKDRNIVPLTKSTVDLGCHAVGVSQHNEILRRFPEPEHPRAGPSFAQIEQHLVTRQVLFRAGQTQIANVHPLVSSGVLYYFVGTGRAIRSNAPRFSERPLWFEIRLT